jgi:Mg-chelatase subunit ChlD
MFKPDYFQDTRNAPFGCTLPAVYGSFGCRGCPSSSTCAVGGNAESAVADPISELSSRAIPAPRTERVLPSASTTSEAPTRDAPLPPPAHSGPRRTVTMIDCSGSMAEDDVGTSRLDTAKGGGKSYVDACARRCPFDEIAVVSFSGDARRVCEWQLLKGGVRALHRAIDSIELDGSTSIGAALAEGETLHMGRSTTRLGWLFERSPGPMSARSAYFKHIILLTDGGHNTGKPPRPIAKRLKEAGVLIDCIGIGARGDVDESLLMDLASVVDGRVRYRYIADADDLLDQYRRLGGNLTR